MHLAIIAFFIFEALFVRIECLLLHTNVAEDVSADYEYNEKYSTQIDVRKSFLRKKKLNEEQKTDVKLLQRILSTPNKSKFIIYSDDVPHHKVKNGSKIYNAAKKLENDFISLLKMKNFKYIFKRNGYWRTWRQVKYPNGTKIIFHYRSNNLVDLKPNCTNCGSSSGFWNIEDKSPPCPYEIFSMSTESSACGITHQNIEKTFTKCPMKISLANITSKCSNPVVTKWKIEKLYSKHDKKSKVSVIGGERENFEITTLYRIKSGAILFQIINSSNEVIYSKSMHPGHENYVCVEDCGIFNPKTLKVSKKDAPLSLDLLNYDHNAKKRENKLGGKAKKRTPKRKKKVTLTTTVKPLELIAIAECYGFDNDYLEPEDYSGATTQWAIIKGRKKKYRFLSHKMDKKKKGQMEKSQSKAQISRCRKLIAKTRALEMVSDSNEDYSY